MKVIVEDLNQDTARLVCYFKKLGLFCLLDAREAEIASLRNGANC